MAALPRMSVRERLLAVLAGHKPDRLPFLDRLEAWHAAHQRAGTLPARFGGLSLTGVHRAVGIGQQRFIVPYGLRLCGVEVISTFNAEPPRRMSEPVIFEFPGMWDLVPGNLPGVTVTELHTPVGKLRLSQELLPEGVANGTAPYLREHLIKESADYATAVWILSRAEFVAGYERVTAEESAIGADGFVVPLLHRIPFQQVLLEYLGEAPLFYALQDDRPAVERLLRVLDEQMQEVLDHLSDFRAPFVEFPDNLHGAMTNPRLFAEYCLKPYQRYTERLHRQGKRVGSHTDGDVRNLLQQLRETGLDVCESVSPAPLTSVEFDAIWEAWRGGPLIWGGIPSPILEARTPQAEFEAWIDRLFATVGPGPIILGIGDMVMGNCLIERVEAIALRVEQHTI
jgi:Uroporphyrinogen decarboxylase (URO-D)